MIQSKGELQGEPYVELESTPTISLYEALKNAQKLKKKMHFTLQLMFHLTVQSRGTPEGILDGTLQDTLSNVHKDAQERAFQVALMGELEISLSCTCGCTCC